MFTGIVETIGTIESTIYNGGYITANIKPTMHFDDLKIGDSISVNGACLTVTSLNDDTFSVDIVPETLRLTNLVNIKADNTVNLERSVTPITRMGGHYVQGHVDATGQIVKITNDNGDALLITIAHPAALGRYIAKKGYICLDGMSLTITDITQDTFSITLIPHTQNATIAKGYRVGQLVNIEVDILAKQLEKLLGEHLHAS